jgi:hypothetical protein
MSETQKLFDKLNRVVWWAGWRPLASLVIGGLFGLILTAVVGPLGIVIGLVLGLALWFNGTRYVNGKAPEIIRAFQTDSETLGRKYLDISEDAEVFQFDNESGSSMLVDAAEQYKVITMLVDESSVSVHSACVLSLPDRSATVDDSTDELFYDQVTGVEYERGIVTIRTSDGGKHQYPSSQKPEAALSAVQQRVRDYKS